MDQDVGMARGWTPSQRRVLTVLAAALLVYAAVLAIRNRAHIDDPPPAEGERAHLLASQIDPNTATVHELALIPHIGESRAREIVAYRDRALARDPHAPPFTRPDDLLRVKGIGPSLLFHMLPHLHFPDPPPPAASPQGPSAGTH